MSQDFATKLMETRIEKSLSYKVFDFNVYYKLIDDEVEYLRKMEDVDVGNAFKKLEESMRLIESFTYTQRQSLKTIRDEYDKKIIAKKADKTLEDVDMLINEYSQFRIFWKRASLLAKEKAEGSIVTLEEITESLQKNRSGLKKQPPVWQLMEHNKKIMDKLYHEARLQQPRVFLDEFKKIK